jgi:membrane-bound serine protease (ClpP class)
MFARYLLRLSLFLAFFSAASSALSAAEPSTAPAAKEPSATETTPVTTGPEAPTTAAKRIAYIKIDGVIDDGKAAYYQRSLDKAVEQKVDVVVVHLTTPGGGVMAAEKITKTALAVPDNGPLMVAYIDRESYSAGSLIAYAHQRVYLSKIATLGNIGVIFQGADGEMKYGPEKIETVIRALLRAVAQKNGWNEALLQKMTARNQDLYQFNSPDGPIYVIEDELPKFLSEHKNFKDEDKILLMGEDRLLSYTADEAIKHKMASGMAKDLDELYRQLGGVPANVLNLAPSNTEEMAWTLGSFAPLLAALAVLFIIMELKTPGIGLWASLAGVCGILFFICQFYLELASYPEVILVVLGVGLIVLELFFLPTGGLIGICGAALGLSGLILAFMPDNVQFNPTSDGWGSALAAAFSNSILALIVGAGGIIALLFALPKMAVASKMAAIGEITATSESDTTNALVKSGLIGRVVTTRSDLTPNGSILVEQREMSAVAEHGAFIKAGTQVSIIDIQFGEAVVRVLETTMEKGTPA